VLSKNVLHGAVPPRGVPKCQICCVLGFFSSIAISPTSMPSRSLPILSPTSPLSHSPRPSPCPRRWTRNSRTERAQRDKNTQTQCQQRTYLSVRRSRLAGRTHNVLDLFLRPFVCPFFRSFVCYQQCERYTSKTNEPISMQIGINLSPGQGHERSILGSGGQRSMSQEAEVMFGSLAETSYSIRWVE